MITFGRILFAVKDTDPRRAGSLAKGNSLAKVIALAKASSATLELFHAVATPLFLPDEGSETSLAAIKRDTLDLHLMRLEKMAVMARKHGVAVDCAVRWDNPPHEAIVRQARATGADLIVADVHAGRGKWLMRLTDWELVRTSEKPVLLLRDPRPYRRPTVLAAVDPLHAHAKPSGLDDEILLAARALTTTLRGKLHLVHANHPSYLGFVAESPLALESVLDAGRVEFNKQTARAGIGRRNTHLVDGDPARVIPEVAENVGARVVVMGAVSRSGLERAFIGNTAERILDKLDCDVLVVKPEQFRAQVSSAPRDALVLTPAPLAAAAR
jgi:universal stress protein E